MGFTAQFRQHGITAAALLTSKVKQSSSEFEKLTRIWCPVQQFINKALEKAEKISLWFWLFGDIGKFAMLGNIEKGWALPLEHLLGLSNFMVCLGLLSETFSDISLATVSAATLATASSVSAAFSATSSAIVSAAFSAMVSAASSATSSAMVWGRVSEHAGMGN